MNITSNSVTDTLRIGRAIAKNLKPQDIVCLFGQLGSGKTVLTKGIAEGLGIKKNKVVSPTFVLIRQHLQGRLPLHHFDLYRLKKAEDILNLGYEEYFYGAGVTIIEWADRLRYLLPKEHLKVELLIRASSRRLLKFTPFGNRYEELLEKIDEDIRA